MSAAPSAARSVPDDGPVIRPPSEADLPRLTEIYNHYIVETPATFDTEPCTVDERREWFSHYAPDGRHRLLVAEQDGRILGYTSSSRFHPRAAYDTTVELTILCAPEAIGIGLGRRLVARLLDDLRREDIHRLMALITLPNEGSCALFEHFGFERACILHEIGRKFDRYWDVAFYTRSMSES